jgi:glycosyltransferase involved in cell wall biosynthesis
VIGRGDAAGGPPGTQVRTIATDRGAAGRGRVGQARRAASALVEPFRARGRVLITLTPDPLPAASARRALGRLTSRLGAHSIGGPLVADCQEDYLALLDDRAWATGGAGVAARALARSARVTAARADLTVVADDHVPPHRARHRLVVRNLPSAGYLPAPTDPDPRPRAVYVGDVRRSRGLHTMLTAIEAAPGWSLDLVGPVSAQDQPGLDEWCASSPAARRVRIHGRLAPGEAWSVASGAWIGLALLDSTPAFVAAIPTKVYEYFGCGIPAMVTPLPRAAALVRESGAGTVVEDAAEAAAALATYVADPSLLAAQRDAAVAWAKNRRDEPSEYDRLAREVVALVGQVGA